MRAGQRLGAPAWASSSSHLMARQPIAFVGQQLDRIVSSIHIVSRGPLKGPDPKRLRRAQYHQSPEFFCQRRRAPACRGYFAVLALTTLHRHVFRRAHTDSLCRS